MAAPGSVVIQFLVDAKKAATDVAGLAKSFGKVDKEAGTLDATLDGIDRELDKIGTASKDLGADMQRAGVGFDSVGDEAEQTATRLRTAARDMADGVHTGAADIDTETGHIRQNMADTGREAGAEFIGNVAEGIGSGTASVTDVMQGTFGGMTNLAASLGGPVGVAAGTAAGAIGLVFSAMKAEGEKAKAQIDGLRGALEGVADKAGEAAEAAIFQQWITDAQTTTGKIENVRDALSQAGVFAGDFTAALAGDPAAQDKVRTALQQQGSEIIKNKNETGKITAEQQKYFDTFPKILSDIHATDSALGAVRREQDAITDLTAGTTAEAEQWRQELEDIYAQARNVNSEVGKIEGSHPVNFIVTTRDRNGRPVHLGPAGLMAPVEPAGVSALAAAAPPTVVNVYAESTTPIRSPRDLVRILENHNVRMGRRPGTPRAVAW